MLLGPIFQVELVSTSRRGRYFALRVLYGALILLVLWTCYEQTQAFSRSFGGQLPIQVASRMAAAFFYSFSWLQMLAIMVVGPAMAVGSIATERERRTIEYLFATDLSNLEIVGGKTIARLLLIASFRQADVQEKDMCSLSSAVSSGSRISARSWSRPSQRPGSMPVCPDSQAMPF